MIEQFKNRVTRFTQSHKSNLTYAALIFIVIIGLETIYRAATEQLKILLPLNEYLTFGLLFLVLSYCNKNVAKGFLLFLLIFFFFQMGNYNYFGYFIFPIEIYLFFTKQREILEVVPYALNMILLPLAAIIVTWIIIALVDRKFQTRKTTWKMSVFFLLILMLPILKLGFTKERNQLGSRPSEDKSILKNSIYVTQYFFGKTFPHLLFNIGTIQAWERDEFKTVANQGYYDNVVFIIGESLTKNHMSLFGYLKATTPNLDKLRDNKNFLYRPAISAGVFTDTAIPAILGVAKKPDATAYIISSKNNLFRLAKQQGYTTYFISAQSRDNFSYIRSYMGLTHIDHYIDSSTVTGDDYSTLQDSFLIDELKKIPLGHGQSGNKNLIILNMAGSHEPYSSRYPAQFNKFGESFSDQYDNSVYYTDHILTSIIEYLQKNNSGKTAFIFTSDHGQHVGESGYGKGNIEMPTDYEVPLLVYSIHADLESEVRQRFDKEWSSHYEIAELVAYYLGYDSLRSIEGSVNDAQVMYVCGGEINGNSGYTELRYLKSGFERIFHY